MNASTSELKKKPGALQEGSPALLMTFTQVAEEVCLSPEAPDWNKAAADAGQLFIELLKQCRAKQAEAETSLTPANDEE